MQPLLALIPPERVAAAAVKAAEEIDALLLELPDETIAAALARPDALGPWGSPPRASEQDRKGARGKEA